MSTTAAIAPATRPTGPRNPGPSWGYRFLRTADVLLPEFIYRPLRAIGTAIAMAGMKAQRRHSRDYLAQVLGRPPTTRDVFRHFFAFEEALMFRLRVANGRHAPCTYGPGTEAFRAWMEHGEPALLGTMHIGVSDTLGFQLSAQARRDIYLVRQRVSNSHDTEALSARMGGRLHCIWVNDPRDLLFALKEAAATDGAIALQCDRLEFSARTETLEFLGAWRRFPFTIYHLALIFDRPVIFSVGVPDRGHSSRLYASPRFARRPGESKADALARARVHFQEFLSLVEGLLREQPYLWFNFLPLNPVAPDPAPAA